MFEVELNLKNMTTAYFVVCFCHSYEGLNEKYRTLKIYERAARFFFFNFVLVNLIDYSTLLNIRSLVGMTDRVYVLL
jgi:hypothetical protein